MIYTDRQDVLAAWLCERIGLVPTPHLRCIARLSGDGSRILAVIGFDGWNGASCEMHVAGEGNWISRSLLHAAFHYPFEVCGCDMVLGVIPSGNTKAIRLNSHLGFKKEHEIVGAHPDGSLIIMSMRRAECRWIQGRAHGQETSTRTPSPARLH